MCQSNVQIMINFNDEFQKMWTFLKIRFESIDWINKWTIINKFEKIHYDEIKNMMIYNEKLTKIKQKIMNFNIFMIDVFVIKILNNFISNFHTFFAFKNNEIRIQKKFFQYEKFMQHLEKKKIDWNKKKSLIWFASIKILTMKTIKTIEKIAIFEKISMIVIVKKMIEKIILMISIKNRIVQIVTLIIRQTRNIVFMLIWNVAIAKEKIISWKIVDRRKMIVIKKISTKILTIRKIYYFRHAYRHDQFQCNWIDYWTFVFVFFNKHLNFEFKCNSSLFEQQNFVQNFEINKWRRTYNKRRNHSNWNHWQHINSIDQWKNFNFIECSIFIKIDCEFDQHIKFASSKIQSYIFDQKSLQYF